MDVVILMFAPKHLEEHCESLKCHWTIRMPVLSKMPTKPLQMLEGRFTMGSADQLLEPDLNLSPESKTALSPDPRFAWVL